MKFKIFGAYAWKQKEDKNTPTLIALKTLINQVNKRAVKELKDGKITIQYNRLRATAGSFLLEGIFDRIKSSDAVIFDITGFSPNVMFELGLAIASSRQTNGAKVFVIYQGKDIKNIEIPSDLAGFFISFYEVKNGRAIFHDNNSLAMRLVSEIAIKFNKTFFDNEN